MTLVQQRRQLPWSGTKSRPRGISSLGSEEAAPFVHPSGVRVVNIRLLVVTLCVFLSAAVNAQVTVPNTFTAGTPAKASEVNANFQALVTAVNSLTARVGKLEGQVTAADLAGTYSLHQFQTELGGGVAQRVATYTSNGTATVTLAANGAVTISSVTSQGHQLNLPGGTLTAINANEPAGNSTWALVSGRVTLLGNEFSISDGGRLLIRTSANAADGTNVLLLLVRMN